MTTQTRLDQWVAGREVPLDNLKVLLIAAIIIGHGVLGYSDLGWWTYGDAREVTLANATETLLLMLAGPFALFLIALLFLVSGLLTPPSLDRKGRSRFVRERLLRLGIPFLVYVLLVQPPLVYAIDHRWGNAYGGFWEEYLGGEGNLDTGPLWFVGVLLLFSLAYAAWTWVVSRRSLLDHREAGAPERQREVDARTLAVVAAVVAPLSFLVRLVYPYGGESGFTDLNLWEWPGCIALFVLGLAGARHGWAAAVPPRLFRQGRVAALAALGGFVLFSGSQAAQGVDIDVMLGGWHWQALVFAALESVMVVFAPFWLLGAAQRHLARPWRHGRPLARSAYGAFLLQTPVLLGLAVLLRPLPVVAEVKAVLVATGGVLVCFGLAWLLVTRVPGLRRVL